MVFKVLAFLAFFQWAFGWNQVKYARRTITHVCFIAFPRMMFEHSTKQCPVQTASLGPSKCFIMHEKTCVIPILDNLGRSTLFVRCHCDLLCFSYLLFKIWIC